MSKWSDKLNEWSTGVVQKYPSNISGRFFFETSVCKRGPKIPYEEVWIQHASLDSMTEQDYSNFAQYIEKSTNTHACAFDNVSGDTRLVIPMPVANKNFITMKEFVDTASEEQQKQFWKCVADEVKASLRKHSKVWVSTHGLGVPYFHVRICIKPKYYVTKKFV